MLPARYDVAHYQGDELTLSLRIRNADNSYENLNGLVGSAQVRSKPTSPDILASFQVTIPDQSVAGNVGMIVCYLSAAQSANLLEGALAYDVQTANPDGSAVRTRVYGTFAVTSQVTR